MEIVRRLKYLKEEREMKDVVVTGQPVHLTLDESSTYHGLWFHCFRVLSIELECPSLSLTWSMSDPSGDAQSSAGKWMSWKRSWNAQIHCKWVAKERQLTVDEIETQMERVWRLGKERYQRCQLPKHGWSILITRTGVGKTCGKFYLHQWLE